MAPTQSHDTGMTKIIAPFDSHHSGTGTRRILLACHT